MRLPYQFNEKSDPKGQDWGFSADHVVRDIVHSGRSSRNIEDRIAVLSSALGGIAELMISKGLMSPQEFLKAIDADSIYEARESKY